MPIINSLSELAKDATEWRQRLHEYPETGYEEVFANLFIKEKLKSWGVTFKEGYATTGVVATIEGRKNSSGKTIGLRADMDGLNITERTDAPHKSRIPGKMHACGHDGHTATLLAAAKYLSETRNFDGTVHLFFQPAEETAGGAKTMIKDGALKDFPCDYVFGLHNWPSIPAGQIGLRPGALFAAVDEFNLKIIGEGGHGAAPHHTIDPLAIACRLVETLHTITSRNTDPVEAAVVTVTSLNVGTGSMNVIEHTGKITGTVRTFCNDTRKMIQDRIETICESTADMFGATIEVNYQNHIGPTISDDNALKIAQKAAENIVGVHNVNAEHEPSTGGEDFASFLQEAKGAFILLGQGSDTGDTSHDEELHSPYYDFNDEIIPIGASYFARIVEDYMKD